MLPGIDPITVAVIQHRLCAIVEEMGESMPRPSSSQILNSSRDFSTALCDPDGRLVAQAEHVPIHVGALAFAARAVARAGGEMHPPFAARDQRWQNRCDRVAPAASALVFFRRQHDVETN